MRAHDVLDVLGVGFGPSNIAIAIALEEYDRTVAADRRLRTLFCEQRDRPQWHPGMLFDDASMQVSFLKDLATFRNPQSPYTFVNFLKSVDRLVDFTNRASMTPLRVEFAAYLGWVTDQLSHYLACATRVESITPVLTTGDDGLPSVDHFSVGATTPQGYRQWAARNVVVSAGLQPRLPTGVTAGQRVWHSGEFLHRVADIDPGTDAVVVGSGQSAVEVALELYRRFPATRVHLVSSRYGISPSDRGPLVNQVFDPSAVDAMFEADPVVRARIDTLHRDTNNAAANPRLIQEMFDLQYRDRWLGPDRLLLQRMSRIGELRPHDSGVTVRIDHDLTRDSTQLQAGVVVMATGYTTFDSASVLGDNSDLVARDSAGQVMVDRDCRAQLTIGGPAGLYLVGQSEHLHGFSTTLLSTVAVRSGEIADSILSRHLSDAVPDIDLTGATTAHPNATVPSRQDAHA